LPAADPSAPYLKRLVAPEAGLVSVGLVTWNSARYLEGCLTALTRQSYGPIELVIVDNASIDGSVALASKLRTPDALIENTNNEGFSRAHNRAIQRSRGEYYLALNPDVVLEPEYVARLVALLEGGERRGSAGGKLWQAGGHADLRLIDSTGLFLQRTRRQILRGRGEVDRGQYERLEQVFGVDGAAPLYRRSMLEDVREADEYFDESFFAYKEDVDLAWRARLLGWESWYDPGARAWHARSFQPGTRGPGDKATRRYSVRNRYFSIIKNETAAGIRRDWPIMAFYDLKILAYLALFERSSLLAFADVVREWRSMWRKRAALQQRARLPHGEILSWID
jgi:GT2 family glycosyltransferase